VTAGAAAPRGESLARQPEVLWRATLTGVAVLPPTTSEPLELTGAAALIWDALDEPVPIDRLGSLIGDDVPAPVVTSAVDQLVEAGCCRRT
jgi:hypothetical protein